MDTNLGSIQLNTEEAEVYKRVLVSGQLSQAEILDRSSLSEESLPQVIESLIERKLLRRVPGMIDRFACLLPLGSTKEELERAAQEVSVLGRELQTTAEQEVTSLQSQLDQAKADLQTQIDDKMGQLDSSVNSLKSTIEATKSDTDGSIASNQESAGSSVGQEIQSANQTVIDVTTKFQTEASGRITSKTESLDRSASSAKVAQETIKAEAGAGLQELDNNAIENSKTEAIGSMSRVFSGAGEKLQSVNASMKTSISTIESGFDPQLESINSAGQQYQSQSTVALNQTKTAISTKTQEQMEKLTSIQASINETTSSISSTIESGMAAQTNLELQTTEKLNSVQSEMSESLIGIQTELQSSVESSTSNLSQLINDTNSKLGGHQTEMEESIKSLVESHNAEIKVALQEKINAFMQETNQKMDELLSSFSSNVATKSAGLTQERSQLVETTSTNIQSQKESINSQLTETINSAKSTQRSVFEGAKNDVVQLSNQQKEQLDNSMSALNVASETISTQFQQGTDQLGEWSESLQSQIDVNLQEQGRLFNQVLQGSINTIKEEVETQSSQLTAKLEEAFGSITADLNSSQTEASQSVEAAINQTIATIQSIHDNMKQKFDLAVDKSREQYNSLIDRNKSDMSELITQLDQDTGIIKEDLTNSMNQHLSQVQEQLSQLVNTTYSQVAILVSSIKTNIDQQLQESEEIGKQIMQSVAELSSSGTASQIDAVNRTFDNYSAKYQQTTNAVSEKATALAGILDTIFKLQEDTDTPMIKTTHVVGKSAIINYVNDMISRVKSKMTILVPEISMLRDSKILEMPRTAQITIVSDIDEVANKEWVDKMHGADANVTLRSLTQQGGFGAQLPDFIGGEREGEEIIIGTLDEGNNDYVAIASNSEDFVKIFGSQIISEYSRGRSKQIMK